MSRIHDLPAASSLAGTAVIPIDNGSLQYKTPISELTSFGTITDLPTTQSIFTSVDALTTGRDYPIFIASAGAQETCEVPENASFYGRAICRSANGRLIELTSNNNSHSWIAYRTTSGWSDWYIIGGKPTSGTITRGSMMNTSDAITVVQDGGLAVLNCAVRIATAGTYGTSDTLITTSIKPTALCRTLFQIGATPVMMRLSSAGALAFNGSTTVTANSYLIGQIVFPVSNT